MFDLDCIFKKFQKYILSCFLQILDQQFIFGSWIYKFLGGYIWILSTYKIEQKLGRFAPQFLFYFIVLWSQVTSQKFIKLKIQKKRWSRICKKQGKMYFWNFLKIQAKLGRMALFRYVTEKKTYYLKKLKKKSDMWIKS